MNTQYHVSVRPVSILTVLLILSGIVSYLCCRQRRHRRSSSVIRNTGNDSAYGQHLLRAGPLHISEPQVLSRAVSRRVAAVN